MNIQIQGLESLRNKIDKMKATVERSKGALEGDLKRLKKEFGLSSLEEAKKLWMAVRKERIEKEKSFKIGIENFEKRWESKLKEGSR